MLDISKELMLAKSKKRINESVVSLLDNIYSVYDSSLNEDITNILNMKYTFAAELLRENYNYEEKLTSMLYEGMATDLVSGLKRFVNSNIETVSKSNDISNINEGYTNLAIIYSLLENFSYDELEELFKE